MAEYNYVDHVPGLKITGHNDNPDYLIDFFDDAEDLGHESNGSRNQFRFLSNFYPEPFTVALSTVNVQNNSIIAWTAREFPTAEHAFQAAKAITTGDFQEIANTPSAAEAKKLGRHIDLVPGWDACSLDVMRQIVAAKFALGTECANLLYDTGIAQLVEGTWWHDRIWGVDLRTQGTPGANQLGMVLMERREQLLWASENASLSS